ncbi:MAG: DEAD/DEAH box helicase [Vicinamibacterales bacterium]
MSQSQTPSSRSSRNPRRRSRGPSRPQSPQPHSRSGHAPDLASRFTHTTSDAPPIAFEELGLDARLNQAVADRGFTSTTGIQTGAIPLVLEGVDLVACAQTGTGKTAAFLLPTLHRLLQSAEPRTSTRVLVLAPTRELAVQIGEDCEGFAYHTDLSVGTIYGGVGSGPQFRALEAPADVIVATPGRLLDLMATGSAKFSGVEVLVLDEADRLLDMGFWPDVRRIVSTLPASRQTLFFSATTSQDVWSAALSIMSDPVCLQVGGAGGPATTITHQVHHVDTPGAKTDWLAHFLRATNTPTIVFVETKRKADRVARRLAAAGIRCATLHADRSQSQRAAAVEGFRAGRHRTLVATDIAARGLDIEGIGHVINYEPPSSPDAYVHRVGRTGRAQAEGVALTLVGPDEAGAFAELQRALRFALTPCAPQDPVTGGPSGRERSLRLVSPAA